MRLMKHDLSHQTDYRTFLLAWLKNDCNATDTASELGIHRNTVRNNLQWMEKQFGVDLKDVRFKNQFVVSNHVQQYLDLKNE